MKASLREYLIMLFCTFIMCTMAILPLLNSASCMAMEKVVEPQVTKFLKSCSDREDTLQVNTDYFHKFLTELPKKFEGQSEIISYCIPKNETTKMPSYNEFFTSDGDEYYWISFFGNHQQEMLSLPILSKVLSSDFSFCNLGGIQEFAKPKVIKIAEDILIKTYSFNLSLQHNSGITYCHIFYLKRPVGNVDFYGDISKVRQEGIYGFFTSIPLRQDKTLPRKSSKSSHKLSKTNSNSMECRKVQSKSSDLPEKSSSKLSKSPRKNASHVTEFIESSQLLEPLRDTSPLRQLSLSREGYPEIQSALRPRKLSSDRKNPTSPELTLPSIKLSMTSQVKLTEKSTKNQDRSFLENPKEIDFSLKNFLPENSEGLENGASLESPKGIDLSSENLSKSHKDSEKNKEEGSRQQSSIY